MMYGCTERYGSYISVPVFVYGRYGPPLRGRTSVHTLHSLEAGGWLMTPRNFQGTGQVRGEAGSSNRVVPLAPRHLRRHHKAAA